jgi:hypothetical protein
VKKLSSRTSRIIVITGLATFALATTGCPTTANPPPQDTGDTAETEDSGGTEDATRDKR